MPAWHDQPELSDEEKAAQRRMCAMLTRNAALAADAFAVDHSLDRPSVTEAAWIGLLVEAAIAFLLSEGVITVNPPPAEGWWFSLRLPDYLMPDVAAPARWRHEED